MPSGPCVMTARYTGGMNPSPTFYQTILLAYRKSPRLKSPEFKFFVKMLCKGCTLLKRVLN